MNEMPESLLAVDEPAPVTVHDANGRSPFLIVADHAGNSMPRARICRHELAMASGEMTEAEFTGFLRAVFERLVAVSQAGAIHFVCMDWRHMGEMLPAGKPVYGELKNLCVWNKSNAGIEERRRNPRRFGLARRILQARDSRFRGQGGPGLRRRSHAGTRMRWSSTGCGTIP